MEVFAGSELIYQAGKHLYSIFESFTLLMLAWDIILTNLSP
jgi:hypothetical protein